MNDIISCISEIEAAAAAVMAEADRRKKELLSVMKDTTRAFDEKLEEETKKKIEIMNIELEDKFRKKAEKLDKQREASIKELEVIYETKHKVLSDKIFERLIES